MIAFVVNVKVEHSPFCCPKIRYASENRKVYFLNIQILFINPNIYKKWT